MSKLNIATANATAYREQSDSARKHFDDASEVLGRAYMRRLNIERGILGKGFDSKAFWANHDICQDVIESTFKRPKLDASGKPVERKGKIVNETNTFNKRDIANAATVYRSGVRTKAARARLIQTHGSIEAGVKNADRLGSVLNLVARLNRAGLVSDNTVSQAAKDAAIEAYKGETATGSARKALLSTLAGMSLTSQDCKLVMDALTAWQGQDTETRQALTFNGILGKVVSINKPRKPRKLTGARKGNGKGKGKVVQAPAENTGAPATEAPATEAPEALTA